MKRALNNAGESSQRYLDDFLVTKGMIPISLAAAAIGYALTSWFQWIFDLPNSPIVATLCALTMTAFAFVRVRHVKRRAEQLRTGINGEKLVAETLDELKDRGHFIVHDIEADGFNIDHVIVGPAGVLVVETKSRTKPSPDAVVSYDGNRVLVNGHAPDRDPVTQAKASAEFVGRRIREVTGAPTHVRPVVVFPDWFVKEGPSDCDVWVLNPLRLLGFIRHEPTRLSSEEARRLAAIVSDFARRPVSKRRTG